MSHYVKQNLPKGMMQLAIVSFVLGFVLLALKGLHFDAQRFLAFYEISFVTLVMVSLGSLFYILIEHLTGAVWSVPYRRVMEYMAKTIPFIGLYGLPLVFGVGSLYHWAHIPEHDHILKAKEAFLNHGAFAGRYVLYFAIWTTISYVLGSFSLKQDRDGDQKWSRLSAWVSGPAMVLLGLTVNFAGFDWIMSLEPHFYSALFGGHIVTATILVGTASITLLCTYLARQGVLYKESQSASWLPFGGFLFAFTLLSVYTAFVQVWLIWYGNIPEETLYIMARWGFNSWKALSWALVFGYFVIPFFGMMSFKGKRDLFRIRFWATWMLMMHFLHMAYLIVGGLRNEQGEAMPFHLAWTDLGFVLFPLGFFLLVFGFLAKGKNLVPLRDPKLARGLHWH